MKMKIISAGPLTTVQDRGRFGYMRYGITTSGVMDEKAYNYGNYLVENAGEEACLEMTFKGAVIEFEGSGRIAFTGADMTPVLNGNPVVNGESIEVKDKDRLEFGFAKKGLRTYLFCKGGIEVPMIYGSRSTNLKCGFGGFEGRKLMDGDVLTVGEMRNTGCSAAIKTEAAYQLPEEECLTVRVLLGPQENYFTDKGIQALESGEYKVTPNSDRMGIRLKGEALESVQGMDIISDAIPLGSIQVSADGQPIILLADRQTTGGYAKIATVIRSDIWKLAQVRPGMSLRFQVVTPRQADKINRR